MITKETTFVYECDVCPESPTLDRVLAFSSGEARRYTKAMGWKRRRNKEMKTTMDVCPDCAGTLPGILPSPPNQPLVEVLNDDEFL